MLGFIPTFWLIATIGLSNFAKGAALNAVKRGDVPKGPWGENGPQLSDVKEFYHVGADRCEEDKFNRAALAALYAMAMRNNLWPTSLFEGPQMSAGEAPEGWKVHFYPPGDIPSQTLTFDGKDDEKLKWIDDPPQDRSKWWVAALHTGLRHYWDELPKTESDLYKKWKTDTLEKYPFKDNINDGNILEVVFVMHMLFDRDVEVQSWGDKDMFDAVDGKLKQAEISPMILLGPSDDTGQNPKLYGTTPVTNAAVRLTGSETAFYPSFDKALDNSCDHYNPLRFHAGNDSTVLVTYIAHLLDVEESWGPAWYTSK